MPRGQIPTASRVRLLTVNKPCKCIADHASNNHCPHRAPTHIAVVARALLVCVVQHIGGTISDIGHCLAGLLVHTLRTASRAPVRHVPLSLSSGSHVEPPSCS